MKNEYVVTRKLYVSWTKENMNQGAPKVSKIVWVISAVAVLILGVFKPNLLPVCVMMAVLCTYQGLIDPPRQAGKQYDSQAKVYGMTDWTRSIEFRENDIFIAEADDSVVRGYEEIEEIRELDGLAWLIFNNRTVIRIYFDAFVSGDWASCKAMLDVKIPEARAAKEAADELARQQAEEEAARAAEEEYEEECEEEYEEEYEEEFEEECDEASDDDSEKA